MTEVGVSLALRRQEKLLASSKEGRMKKREATSPKGGGKSKSGEHKPINSSWEAFFEGAFIYALCLIIPAILGRIVRWYGNSWEANGILRQLALHACSSSWLSGLQWCTRNTKRSNSMSVLAPDAGISDVAIVGTLCLFMAFIRLTLVHFLVPNYNQPKRLAALVRCKSIHLLSSSYPGTVTPKASKGKTLNLDGAGILLSIPNLDSNTSSKTIASKDTALEPKRLFASSPAQEQPFGDQRDSLDPDEADLGLWLDDDQDERKGVFEEDDEMDTAPAVSAGLISSSSALSLQNLLHQAAPMTPKSRRESRSTNRREEPDRIYAAPKYATACFRMLFCSFSCVIAMIYFNDADFWPPAVGGNGSTKKCWDLSSVGAAVMDSDFDHHNTVLRRYYLLQLSYHFHSGAFHIIAALLLWFVSSSKDSEKSTQSKILGVFPPGLFSMHNLQSLFQHCFAIGMMTFTYLFSSLRRLGVIAMFAFDLSSWFLHLLQMGINTPSGRRRIAPFWIRILHRAIVIPAFCYSRFYIFPFVIGYSALEESQDWLRQLENMLIPGTAKYIHGVFVVSFCVLMGINVVYARRLLYHSHVKDTVDRSK